MIVGFGAAAGEEDLLWAGAEERGDLFASRFDRGASLLAERVNGRSVAELRREIGQHGVEDFGLDGRGGVVIEVDAVHGAVYRILLGRSRCSLLEAVGRQDTTGGGHSTRSADCLRDRKWKRAI